VDGCDHWLGEEGESIESVLPLARGLLGVGGPCGGSPSHFTSAPTTKSCFAEVKTMAFTASSRPRTLQLLAELGAHGGERVLTGSPGDRT
jgi:hypothetical protein